jgi:hypothetical protein
MAVSKLSRTLSTGDLNFASNKFQRHSQKPVFNCPSSPFLTQIICSGANVEQTRLVVVLFDMSNMNKHRASLL